MHQTIIYIKDIVDKTITITDQHVFITNEYDDNEYLVSANHRTLTDKIYELATKHAETTTRYPNSTRIITNGGIHTILGDKVETLYNLTNPPTEQEPNQ